MNPETWDAFWGSALLFALLLVGCAAVVFLVQMARRRASSDLPRDLLDEHGIHPAGEWLEIRGRVHGGRRVRFLIDRRHAHVLSDQLLRAAAQHYRNEKDDNHGPPALSS